MSMTCTILFFAEPASILLVQIISLTIAVSNVIGMPPINFVLTEAITRNFNSRTLPFLFINFAREEKKKKKKHRNLPIKMPIQTETKKIYFFPKLIFPRLCVRQKFLCYVAKKTKIIYG